MHIESALKPADLNPNLDRLFELSAQKIESIEQTWDPKKGTPVFTVQGKYTTRGWTEWTQGFQYGCALIQFDVTSDLKFLELGRKNTVQYMAPHVSHIGVHDHGFNNVSTYGNLRRFMNEGKIPENEWERHFYEMALKVSGAVQASRWSPTDNGFGYVYSFNGPHSLFVDTIRSMRALAMAHKLGHVLMGEHDEKISLLKRLIHHARNTARYNVYYGTGRDSYDVRGRALHEAIFNRNDGRFRCPSTQQGYSPFSTWTRGLSWAITGFAEQLEFLSTLDDSEWQHIGEKKEIIAEFEEAAMATADYYIEHTPTDGIPYWDNGAPGLDKIENKFDIKSNPDNDIEPIDSSAAAITGQGLLRLGNYLNNKGKTKNGEKYTQAGLTVAKYLFDDPYLSNEKDHQGLLLHSIYHQPNGWDYIPKGSKIAKGESCMWGDYHAMEFGLMIWRMIKGEPYYTFYS